MFVIVILFSISRNDKIEKEAENRSVKQLNFVEPVLMQRRLLDAKLIIL